MPGRDAVATIVAEGATVQVGALAERAGWCRVSGFCVGFQPQWWNRDGYAVDAGPAIFWTSTDLPDLLRRVATAHTTPDSLADYFQYEPWYQDDPACPPEAKAHAGPFYCWFVDAVEGVKATLVPAPPRHGRVRTRSGRHGGLLSRGTPGWDVPAARAVLDAGVAP